MRDALVFARLRQISGAPNFVGTESTIPKSWEQITVLHIFNKDYTTVSEDLGVRLLHSNAVEVVEALHCFVEFQLLFCGEID